MPFITIFQLINNITDTKCLPINFFRVFWVNYLIQPRDKFAEILMDTTRFRRGILKRHSFQSNDRKLRQRLTYTRKSNMRNARIDEKFFCDYLKKLGNLIRLYSLLHSLQQHTHFHNNIRAFNCYLTEKITESCWNNLPLPVIYFRIAQYLEVIELKAFWTLRSCH